MGTYVVFQWAKAVLSPQFLSLIPSDIDRAVLLSEVTTGLRLTTDLTSDMGYPALQGQWEDILCAQIKLIELLTKWQEQKESEKIKSECAVNKNNNDYDNLNRCESNKIINGKENVKLQKSNSDRYALTDTVVAKTLPKNYVDKIQPPQEGNSAVSALSKAGGLSQDVQNVYVISNDGDQLDLVPSLTCSVPTIPQDSLTSSVQDAEQISVTVRNSSQLILVTRSSVEPKNQNNAAENEKKKEELYMNIVLASRKDYTASLSEVELRERGKIENGNRENPLDKLCQLLRIDEEESTSEAVVKNLDEFERRRRYEEKMPFKYFCSNCSFKTKRESQYLKHLKHHEKHSVIYHCTHCQFTTIWVRTLRRHERLHNESHLVNCPKCPYKTDSLKFLRRHIQVKHSNKPAFQCGQCDFAANSWRELKKHRHIHNPAKPKMFWNCSLCSYKTQNKGHLQRHKNDIHELVRPYLCHLCGKSFKRHDTLKQHKVTHGETGPTYTCSQCNKVYRSTTRLKEHMAVHTSQRPFLCELCGATFKTRSNQSKHIKMMHSAVKPFPCPICKRVFSNKPTMTRHQKIHRPKESNGVGEAASGTSKSFSSNNPQQSNVELNSENIDH